LDISAGRSSSISSRKDESVTSSGAEATPSTYSYAHPGYSESDTYSGPRRELDSGNDYMSRLDYVRSDDQPHQEYASHMYMHQVSDDDETGSLGGMAAVALSSRPLLTQPISTLELIPNAPKMDPRTLPPQDKFLSQFNPQLR
ncbi:hypothetical protein LPJ75_005851, partial [Coemansia sp. RSA 2598]